MSGRVAARARLLARLDGERERLVALCCDLVRADSRNPPGDTAAVAELCRAFLADRDGITVEVVAAKPGLVNVVARVHGGRSGPRLALNGHLDTGVLPDPELWTVPPFGGERRDGRIHGRGAPDMKAGVAAFLVATAALAEVRAALAGELVLTLVADEGSGGAFGTRLMLARDAGRLPDAMLSADVGSPQVIHLGEKGFLWLELTAEGRSAGGAHVHRGVNAIDRLTDALAALRALPATAPAIPPVIRALIETAGPVSEAVNGAGETATLLNVTVNVGTVQGGLKINQVPSGATARIDVRVPPGVTVDAVLGRARELIAPVPGVALAVLDRAEPTWTAPEEPVARRVLAAGREVLGRAPVRTIRPGFSDARFYRERGIPAVGYGATAGNGNGPDEFATEQDLHDICRVHALAAFDLLDAV